MLADDEVLTDERLELDRANPRYLSVSERSHVQALLTKGYSATCVAALFDVSETTVRLIRRGPELTLTIPLAKPARTSFRLNWSQRVIWGAER